MHFLQHEFKAVPIIKQVMGRMRAPKDLMEQVIKLVANHMFPLGFGEITPKAVRRMIARVGEDLIYDLVDLRFGDRIASGKALLSMGKVGKLKELIEEELADPAFSLKNLTISGHDLIELGMKPGPQMGKILNTLLEAVMDDKGLNEKSILLAMAKKIMEEGVSAP